MVGEMDPTELAVIMIPVDTIRRPCLPCQRCTLQVLSLALKPPIPVECHVQQSSPWTGSGASAGYDSICSQMTFVERPMLEARPLIHASTGGPPNR